MENTGENGKEHPPPTPEMIAQANALKDEGNALLAQSKFVAAALKYSEAIEIHPTAIFYSNRAQAMIKLESFGLAIQDANEALKLDKSYIKAYYRRGSANYALGKLKQALKDFKAVVSIRPKDPDALKKMKACDKAVKEEAFLKAIESDREAEPPVDAASIVVEDSYLGPRLETDDSGNLLVTVEFVHQLLECFKDQKLLHKKYVIQMLQESIKMFSSLPSLLRLSLPGEVEDSPDPDGKPQVRPTGTFTVCGDTHGQFYDLCNIFRLGGFPSSQNHYLFNGDYVDRGSFSVENVLALMALKLALPGAVHMLRGNHETKNMNKIYGFEGEVKHKYDDVVMGLFAKMFQWLPLAAVIHDQVFVVHGGLSTDKEGAIGLSALESISRGREPPESGIMSDLLWADPQPENGKSPSKRGLGFSFGPDYTDRFLKTNNLNLVIRSHEVKDEGYVVEHGGKCVTIFSAPNYCDQMGNKGAFLRFSGSDTETTGDGAALPLKAPLKAQFTKYEAVPHPNVPPMRYAGNMFSL